MYDFISARINSNVLELKLQCHNLRRKVKNNFQEQNNEH